MTRSRGSCSSAQSRWNTYQRNGRSGVITTVGYPRSWLLCIRPITRQSLQTAQQGGTRLRGRTGLREQPQKSWEAQLSSSRQPVHSGCVLAAPWDKHQDSTAWSVPSQTYNLHFPRTTPYCMRYAAVTGAAGRRWDHGEFY